MRTTKLGAAVLAALAAMAIGATAAQATEWFAEKYPAAISGEQVEGKAFTWGFEDSTTAACETVGFGGELTKAATSMTLTTGSTGCTAFGKSEATVNMNECTLVLKPTSGSGDSFSGTVDISCPSEKKIVITGGNCEVKVGAQTALGTVSYTVVTRTNPEPDEVEAKFSITTLAYEKTNDGLLCPLTGTGSKTTGTIGGTVLLKAGTKEEFKQFDLAIK